MTDHTDASPLDRLADLAGILARYTDLAGEEHVASPATKRALLAAMGLDGDPEARLAELEGELAGRPLPYALVAAADAEGSHNFAAWALTLESGERLAGDGPLPALPMGLHTLEVEGCEALLVAAPARAPRPDEVARGRRVPGDAPEPHLWGYTAALYGLHAARNPDLGDYDNLAVAAEALAGHGADFLGINPVHALGAASGMTSPYSPTHRGFLNTAHIALPAEALEGEAGAPDLIDYERALARRAPALRRRFAAFDDPTGDFAAFRARRGRALEDFALFEALSLEHGDGWQGWPEGYESPDAPAARAFAEVNAGEIAFHAWLQWLADAQLGEAQARARAAGMALGLYTDMAVGVRPGGAEVWCRPEVFARGVSLGAPPDVFNPAGQTWGLAPLNPLGLARAGYMPFVETVRAVLRHAGLARIDHVLGLNRCFWVPEGEDLEEGAVGGYVRYPLEVLLAIVRLEAWRLGCVVVGEDLGVVPAGLREQLGRAHLYGCTVMQFERDDEERLKRPADHRTESLASFGTHDTPTLKGFWEERDIEWRLELGQFDEDEAERTRAERAADRARLVALMVEAGLIEAPESVPETLDGDLAAALHALLGRSAAALVAVQLDDALGVLDQPNFPGTVEGHPNWRRRAPVAVESLAGDESVQRVSAATAAGRRAGRGG